MTHEEYKDRKNNLQIQRNRIDDEMRQLDQDYINSFRQCDIGDVVTVEHKSGKTSKGHVVGFKIDSFRDQVIPILKKMKNDGTPSRHGFYVWHDDNIVYPEKAVTQNS